MEEDIKKEQSKEGESTSQNGGDVDELAKCEKERDEYLDGWERAKADMADY